MKLDASYSPDVEIGPDNKLYAARDIQPGEIVRIPLHMMDKAHKRERVTR